MRFAIGEAAAHGRADSRRFARIDRVHIEREMEAGGAFADAISIASVITDA